MNLDISDILDDWPYDNGQISARKIRSDDGTDKIQLRLDLGVLQMEMTGRPDGRCPHGYKSLLAYYEHLLERRDSEDGPDKQFELSRRDCELLRNEGVMYYHRYLAEFILEEYEAVVQDVARSLRLIDFCDAYAKDKADRQILRQHRPYVLMMRTRARALLALRNDRPKAALAAVREGVEEIQEFHERAGQHEAIENSRELMILRGLIGQIEEHVPIDPVKRVAKKLDAAVSEERYEDAAGLRDQLRQMTGEHFADGGL